MVENIDRPAGENRPGKEEQGHIRAPPGTVDGEKAQPCTGQTVEMGIGVRHQFVGFLAGGIQRDRVIDIVVHRKRHAGIGPVDR